MECQHDLIIVDGFSDEKSFKITLCKKCLKVVKVTIQGEKSKEKSVWDVKDLRISKMSALKTASELALGRGVKAEDLINETLLIAKELLNWIYE